MPALLGQVPPVLQHLVVHLGRLELAAQVPRHGADDRLEHLRHPVVRDELLVVRLPARRGAVGVEVVEQPAGLVLPDVEAGQPQQPPGVVAGVDHLGLDAAPTCPSTSVAMVSSPTSKPRSLSRRIRASTRQRSPALEGLGPVSSVHRRVVALDDRRR